MHCAGDDHRPLNRRNNNGCQRPGLLGVNAAGLEERGRIQEQLAALGLTGDAANALLKTLEEPPAHVIVVEDDPDIAELISGLLRDRRFRVTATACTCWPSSSKSRVRVCWNAHNSTSNVATMGCRPVFVIDHAASFAIHRHVPFALCSRRKNPVIARV